MSEIEDNTENTRDSNGSTQSISSESKVDAAPTGSATSPSSGKTTDNTDKVPKTAKKPKSERAKKKASVKDRPLASKRALQPDRGRGADTKEVDPSEKYANWNFPKNSLEEAIRVAQALEEKFAGKPTPSEDLARAVDFKKVSDWRWKDLLRSANSYGLVKGTGATATVEMAPIGADIVAPKIPEERKAALIRAFETVPVFKKVVEHYGNKAIPDDEYFANTLVREFEIVRDRVPTFIEVYKANAKYIGTFRGTTTSSTKADGGASAPAGVAETNIHPPESEQDSREFLGTCFVLMPFGFPFDRCYEEVYKRAIRDAGLEPFRADGLFNSGTVIEQIWEQINKAEVLLAEVTGKNANVFYELGLSHAISKPVILISSSLDDVPFDLRHLRVIIYDVYDPHWGDKLKKSIVDFVKSARRDPAKSVPQPFREPLVSPLVT